MEQKIFRRWENIKGKGIGRAISLDKKSPKKSFCMGNLYCENLFLEFILVLVLEISFEFGRELYRTGRPFKKKTSWDTCNWKFSLPCCLNFLNKKRAPLVEQSQSSFDLIGFLLLLKTHRSVHVSIRASKISKKMFLDIHGLSAGFLRIGA